MFPNRPPRRNMFMPYRRSSQYGHPFINQFRTSDGYWDFEKIYKSVNDINKLVGQVNPIIQQFSKMSNIFNKIKLK